MEMPNQPLTNDEIAAFVEGSADRVVSRRVLAAALQSREVRARIELLREAQASYATGETAPDFPHRAHHLRDTLTTLTRQTAWDAAGYDASAANTAPFICHLLTMVRQALTLPCLSPAFAAPVASAFQRTAPQRIDTAEGVRIEFHQLPGTTPQRLRVFVDASRLAPNPAASPAFDTAHLTLEEATASAPAGPRSQVLAVSLNAEGKGMRDFVIREGEADYAATPNLSTLATPHGAVSLVSASLVLAAV